MYLHTVLQGCVKNSTPIIDRLLETIGVAESLPPQLRVTVHEHTHTRCHVGGQAWNLAKFWTLDLSRLVVVQGEGFHVKAKLRKTAYIHSLLWKAADEVSMHATKWGTSFAVHLPCFSSTIGLVRTCANRLCQARNARAEVRACVVLLPTRGLLPGRRESVNGLATLLDNMRESIHAPHCNLWCLQVTQSKRISLPVASRGKPVLICNYWLVHLVFKP